MTEDDVALKLVHTADWHLGRTFPGFDQADQRKLTRARLQVIDRIRLGADMAKIVWHPNLVDRGEEVQAIIKGLLDRDGPEKWILCRCDNREAIDFGRSVGINQFQGRYVENLIAEDGRRRDLLKLKRRIERSSEPQSDDA